MQIQNPFEEITERLINIEHSLRELTQRGKSFIVPPLSNQPDQVPLNQALLFLKEQGYPVSRSKFYKLTAAKKVPFKNFGRKLIFSRKQLLSWVESQTVDNNGNSEAALVLARSARKKQKGGRHA